MAFPRAFSILLVLAVCGGDAAAIKHSKHPAKQPAKHAAQREATRSTKQVSAKPNTREREERAAARWMKNLSLHDEVAQLVFVPFSGQPLKPREKPYKELVRLVKKEHVGGMILVNVFQGHLVKHADPVQAATIINKMQKSAKIPLLLSADLERGASMRLNDTTGFPHAMAFTAGGDPESARLEGAITAREARAVGIQWVFYPDADVNNNPDNPIINIRSFGENPADVARFGKAFIEGTRSDPRYRVLTTVKHFPGHGDTATDTHVNIATVPGDREHLNSIELPPFRAGILEGVDAVMTAHLAVPALEKPEVPATLSKNILTTLLRGELGFHGIVVTDALEMGGIAKGFTVADAAVRAIEAGADVLLMPSDPDAAIDAVVSAVNSGRIPRQRIQESVHRILAAKARVGLDRERLVNTKAIPKLISQPAAVAAAQQIADRAITLVKNEGGLVPLRDPSRTLFLLLRESKNGDEGQAFSDEMKKRLPAANIRLLDPQLTEADLTEISAQAKAVDTVVVCAFASVAAYSNRVSLRGQFPDLMKRLTASGKPIVMAALGNPYLLRSFPEVAAYLAAYSTVTVSEVAVLHALLGETAIAGRLPVTIPGLAQYGDGLQVSATVRSGTAATH